MSGAKILICLLSLGVTAIAPAATAVRSTYRSIVERNVFGLNPSKSEDSPAPVVQPPPKITLAGITTLLGNKRALLSVLVSNKPPENFILTEGQRDGEIEVLQIDEKAGSVKVLNHGIEQTLDFLTAGVKPQPSLSPTGYSSNGLPVLSHTTNAPVSAHKFPVRSLRLPRIPETPPTNTAPITVP